MFGKYKSEHALLSPRNYSAKPTRPFACVILYLCSHCVVVLSHLICNDRRTVWKQKDVGLEVRKRAVCFWLCHQLPAAPGRSPCFSLSYLEAEELEDLSPSQVMVRLHSSTGVKKPRPCLEDISVNGCWSLFWDMWKCVNFWWSCPFGNSWSPFLPL